MALILLASTLVLLFLEYAAIRPAFFYGRPIPIQRLARWSLLSFAAYFIFPALLVTMLFRERLRDFGLSFTGVARHIPLYILLYLLVLPFVYFASRDPAFLRTYPFADSARDGALLFLYWELLYGLQFFALEFFFRGFMIFGLEERFGRNAILVMVVPYCMLHFHKPMPEAAGAVVAGLVLGALALKTRSIFGGVMIHWAVAVTMDLFAIIGRGGFR